MNNIDAVDRLEFLLKELAEMQSDYAMSSGYGRTLLYRVCDMQDHLSRINKKITRQLEKNRGDILERMGYISAQISELKHELNNPKE